MSHFEIVRVDGGWFVRFYAANNRIVWVTPGLHSRRRAALRAVEIVAGPIRHSAHADWPEVTLPGEELPVEVRETDERPPPPAPAVIEPPFYVSRSGSGDFWHDSDYHWRHCYDSGCVDGMPDPGTLVRGRFDLVAHKGSAS